MTGSVALDVVIGLVFIYLLYSLFATVLMEIINSFMGLRARNLRYALRRMLMDEKKVTWTSEKPKDKQWKIKLRGWLNLVPGVLYKLGNALWNFTGRSSGDLSNKGLFYTFYDQPSIKYLSKGGISNKPSYIAPHNFSKTIMDSLQLSYQADMIFKNLNISFDTLNKSYQALGNDSEVKQHIESQLDSKTFKSWFDELGEIAKIKYATSILSSNEDLNNLWKSVVNRVGADPGDTVQSMEELLEGESLLEKIKAGISALPESSDTRKHLESLLKDANNDLQKFKLYLEDWFNDTMERAAGWFKRRIQFILFFVGLFLAVSFNADTIDIVKKLSNDPNAREQMVELAIAYSEDNKDQIQVRSNIPEANDSQQVDDNDSLNRVNDSLRAKANDSLLKVAQNIQKDIYNTQNIISANWEDLGEGKISFWRKLSYVLEMENWKFKRIWGYLLTALAISLGSPFWFDLLNKLVKLRGSTQPEKESGTGAKQNKRSGVSPKNRVG